MRLGLASLVAAGLGLAAGFAWFVTTLPTHPSAAAPPGAAIVVLTGGAGRIDQGLALLAADPDAILLVSGVHQSVTLPELIAAAGVPPSARARLETRVTIGRRAVSTRGNAEEAQAWWSTHAPNRPIVVVSASYHIRRAMVQFRRAMPRATLIAWPVVPPGFGDSSSLASPPRLRLLASEYLKLMAAIAGLAGADPPADHRP